MSLDATNWAWRVKLNEKKGGCLKSLKRLVLLSLADRAGESHTCYPSMQRLEKDTDLERKTVLKIISELIDDGLIMDTGERKGATKRIKVYKLLGVNGRETVPTMEQLGQKNLPETVPQVEQFQQRNDSINGTLNSAIDGTLNSANNGTQNLPMNLPIESKNKKTWICFKKLREEIFYADSEIDFTGLIMSSWYEREIQAFEDHNENKPMSDAVKIYHFADWLLNAKLKYDRRQQQANLEQAKAQTPQKMSDKQLFMFAQKLAHHSEFSGRYGTPGQSYEQLASWVAVRLSNPKHLEEWARYLKEVGFTGKLGVAA